MEQLEFSFNRRPLIIHFYKQSRRLRGDEVYIIESTMPGLPVYRTQLRSEARGRARELFACMGRGEGNIYIWIQRTQNKHG